MSNEIVRDNLVEMMLESREIMPLTADEFVDKYWDSTKYVGYCEVVIDKNGNIYELHGSHTTMLEFIYCWMNKVNSTEMFEEMPRRYYGDMNYWLLEKTKAISVRFEKQEFNSINPVTDAQKKTLNKLAGQFINLDLVNLRNRYL